MTRRTARALASRAETARFPAPRPRRLPCRRSWVRVPSAASQKPRSGGVFRRSGRVVGDGVRSARAKSLHLSWFAVEARRADVAQAANGDPRGGPKPPSGWVNCGHRGEGACRCGGSRSAQPQPRCPVPRRRAGGPPPLHPQLDRRPGFSGSPRRLVVKPGAAARRAWTVRVRRRAHRRPNPERLRPLPLGARGGSRRGAARLCLSGPIRELRKFRGPHPDRKPARYQVLCDD
jgi:hypothetical protein